MERRTRKRTKGVLAAHITGTKSSGKFEQLAYTLDISRQGAQLGGIRVLLSPGDVIEIQRLHRKSRFQVKWVQPVGGSSVEFRVGLLCLEPEKDLWKDLWNVGGPRESTCFWTPMPPSPTQLAKIARR